jgi:hypothetical protein
VPTDWRVCWHKHQKLFGNLEAIEQRASEDARRTERAVDNNMNAVKKAVDNVKDSLN